MLYIRRLKVIHCRCYGVTRNIISNDLHRSKIIDKYKHAYALILSAAKIY